MRKNLRAYLRQYYQKNRAKMLAYNRKRMKDPKVRARKRERDREYHRKNRAKRRAYSRAYYRNNRDSFLTSCRERFLKNRTKLTAQWRAERRARKEAGTCTLCGRKPIPGRRQCSRCTKYYQARAKAAKGLCCTCRTRKPLPGKRICQRCRRKLRAWRARPSVQARYRAYASERNKDPKVRALKRAYNRERRKNPKVQARERARYRELNKDPKRRARKRAQRLANHHRRMKDPQYRRRVRALVRAIKHRRRVRLLSSGDSWTPSQFEALCIRYRRRCLCCGKRRKLTADHVIPVAKWPKGKPGLNSIRNIQPLCKPCNCVKNCHRSTDYRKNPHPNCLKRC